ncbi:hypothetical protein G7Y89_g1085 [Cudoniella acicularis]|uniref:Transcriptional coactivator p15 (PC4) C-terminal domain-containing protein n=1 Tax=Cudoniella acicularis TaxID=354080 RepID=A0A8H4W894_9HELO|nr:hypothetical protein G7Y89_g1085 [Cudoniella acicularis]
MAKGKRARDQEDDYDSDGGFVSNDDGKAPKTNKKAKKAAAPKAENNFWELSTGRNPRRVEITDFKGKKLINIREYYEKDGEYLPGKKGISLTVEQYTALAAAVPAINSSLKLAGIAFEDAMDEDQSEEEAKPKKRVKAKKETKTNIDATSDEEE